MITSNSIQEISYSDNSHIFGVPFSVHLSLFNNDYLDAYMDIDREDLRQWIEKTINLPLDFHFHFKKE